MFRNKKSLKTMMLVFAIVFIVSMVVFTILPLLTASQYPSSSQQAQQQQQIQVSPEDLNITTDPPTDTQLPEEPQPNPFQYNTNP